MMIGSVAPLRAAIRVTSTLEIAAETVRDGTSSSRNAIVVGCLRLTLRKALAPS